MSAVTEVTQPRSTARRWATVLAPVAALVVGIAACSSNSGNNSAGSAATSPAAASSQATGSASASASASGDTVDIKNFTFSPMALTVAVGTTVTWKFEDSAAHTVKASDNSFSSAALSAGKTFQHTFDKAGTYSYICSIHQYMTGTITVK